MKRFVTTVATALTVAAFCGCSGAGISTTPQSATPATVTRNGGSLGPVLTTSDAGQVFGFDIDQNGNDGILASWGYSDVSVQTFDATTGKITKTFDVVKGGKVTKGDDYVFDGIFAGDAGLVDFQKAGIPGQTPAKDRYHLALPVTKERLNGRWQPPLKLFNVEEWAPNQSTTTGVVFGYQREGSDTTSLVVTDVAKNTFGKVITLSDRDFSLGTTPQLAEDTKHNLAVMASSPSFGEAGGPPPVITAFDLKTGKLTAQFNGVNCPGSAGCGSANGIGFDSSTGIACTTTEIDGGVEFYDVAKKTGFHEEPPNGGQFYAGTYVAADTINHLFLIAQPFSSTSSSGSSIQVYQENGSLLESINGFNFTDAGDLAIPIRVSINPNNRTGWVNGPNTDQLQEFSY